MSGYRRRATLDFKDEYPSNPIMSIVIAHSTLISKHQNPGTYQNVDPDAHEVFSLYGWTKWHPGRFTPQGDGYLSYGNAVMIDQTQHDVWSVAFQRKQNKYVEYIQQTEGFWRKVEEKMVKEICNAAIEAADIFDDETTTPIATVATDKAIHEMFTRGNGDVIIKNWVHWDSHQISFRFDSDSAHIHSGHHRTSCKPERFGDQNEKK